MNEIVLDGPPLVKNDKHRQFADLVLSGMSQTKAAMELGYAPATCGVRGVKLAKLPAVANYLAWQRSRATEDTNDTQTRIVQELEDMALNNNIEDLIRIDDDGTPIVDFSNATRAQLKSVTSVASKTSVRYDKEGQVIGTEKQSRFGYVDKYRGLELLGKHVGMFKPDEQRVIVDVADRLLTARRRLAMLGSEAE